MSEVINYLKRILERTHLTREKFTDAKTPTNFASLRFTIGFPDIRHEYILSTILFPRITKPSDYTILCSWKGHSGLYQNVDEYWSISDETSLNRLHHHAQGFNNTEASTYYKLLLRFVDRVDDMGEVAATYYNNGPTKKFIDQFHDLQYYLPTIPSVRIDTPSNQRKIFIHPVKYAHSWDGYKQSKRKVPESFWTNLTKEITNKKYAVVVFQNEGTYDLSPEFGAKCAYVSDKDILTLLGVMRGCTCVLDVFSGVSRYAIIARSPFFICDERQRYFDAGDDIVDGWAAIPNERLFSFCSLTEDSSGTLVQAICNQLDLFITKIQNIAPLSMSEVNTILPYDAIKNAQNRKMGSRFLRKVPILK